MRQQLMAQIQYIAQVLTELIRESGCWAEDTRDSPPSAVYRQMKSGVLVHFSNNFPYSITSSFGEWVIAGKNTGTKSQRLELWRMIHELISVSLAPIKGSGSMFYVSHVEGESIERPESYPHRGEFRTPKECLAEWDSELCSYMAQYHSAIVGRTIAMRPTGLMALLRSVEGQKVSVLDMSPYGIVRIKTQVGEILEMPVTSLAIFRERIIP